MSDAASDIVLARRVSGEVLLPDADAAEIGELYRKAGASLIESVEYSRACGQRLAAKKASLPHGAWLPWLRDNADVLGFNSRQTASRLMALANGTLNAPFDEAEAVAISRNIWGNDTRRVDAYTGEMEWYTPSVYIEAARKVLGEIDLDPASCEQAQKTVRARHFFTVEDDGLAQDWKGVVWLNPPYAGELIAGFADKMLEQIACGNVTSC